MDTLPSCDQIGRDLKRPAVDLTVIIDSSRRRYESLQVINAIAEAADVSSYGSYISVIHGGTSEFIVNRTNSIATTFVQLRNFTGDCMF